MSSANRCLRADAYEARVYRELYVSRAVFYYSKNNALFYLLIVYSNSLCNCNIILRYLTNSYDFICITDGRI
jgi:hypothetical protein